jgi:LacI family transcriptional regulator
MTPEKPQDDACQSTLNSSPDRPAGASSALMDRGSAEKLLPHGRDLGDTSQMRRTTVTMLDVARHAGVSRATVSLALQGSPLLKAETRQQVVQAATALGYVYNRGAANLRKLRSDSVGMVINDLTNPFFAELAVGCERVLQCAGHVVFLANTAEDSSRQADVLKRMQEQGVAGIVVCPARGTVVEALAALHIGGIPVVQAMRYVDLQHASIVIPDNSAGATAAVAHLVTLGHRRIAFAGGFKDTSVFSERTSGYRAGLEAAGIERDPALIVQGPPTREFGVAAVPGLLAGPQPATAVLAFNDTVALGICRALQRFGQEPGRNFAVIGFDDVSESAHSIPALSTIAVDPQGLGEIAARMLLRQIGQSTAKIEKYVGPVRLVIRDTCGGAPDARLSIGASGTRSPALQGHRANGN